MVGRDAGEAAWHGMDAVLPKTTAAKPGPAARRARVSPPRAVLLWLVLLPLLGLLALRMEWGAETGSEEHTSELQSLMRISYAVFCLKKKIQSSKTYQALHTHL